jgi:hypothetical protein
MSDPAKRDAEVKPGNPLKITDFDRNFGTITIYPGGQVFVMTIADVTIDKLVKLSN